MSKSKGPVALLAEKAKRLGSQHVHGSYNRWAVEPIELNRRDGGSMMLEPSKAGALELQAIYNQYVSVYDKCNTIRRRKTYYRRPRHTMMLLNDMRKAPETKRSVAELAMRSE